MIDERGLAILLAVRKDGPAKFTDLLQIVSNPKTLSSKLSMLEREGLVSKDNRAYVLTDKGAKGVQLLEEYSKLVGRVSELTNIDRIPHAAFAPMLKDFCRLLRERYTERLKGVILFGSVARGDWRRESDVDLLVVVDGWAGQGEWSRLEEVSGLQANLSALDSYRRAVVKGFSPAIHVLPMDPGELKDFRTIYLDIVTDGVVLFDGGGMMRDFVESTRLWMKERGTKRVVHPDGTFHWVITPLAMGEVVQLGN